MKMIIALVALVAVAAAAPVEDVVVVKSQENNNIGVDGYQYSYELSNGQNVEETGELRNVAGEETPVIVVRGSFSYTDPATGTQYTVTYVADENGFQPTGAHIPA
ncbi:flexible cuticle protein 12-like [Microplitis mediator]|uniref:flexible cuticle protein 12-like n=1 Tax=Microplitis mediator TaxID=375433 RepID=UPI0025539C82|nr:flexible cuticle protein 12-like [Microplitis mediator]